MLLVLKPVTLTCSLVWRSGLGGAATTGKADPGCARRWRNARMLPHTHMGVREGGYCPSLIADAPLGGRRVAEVVVGGGGVKHDEHAHASVGAKAAWAWESRV